MPVLIVVIFFLETTSQTSSIDIRTAMFISKLKCINNLFSSTWIYDISIGDAPVYRILCLFICRFILLNYLSIC